ncbi:MAG: 3-dehydroquinate synthase [Chthoniobacterales bacterium]|nr:3-dehydroquinate synthase [Chthoniobacterales bacterium]
MSTVAYNVSVNLPGQTYVVTIAPGILRETGRRLTSIAKTTKAAVLTDKGVGPLHAPALRASLDAAGIACVQASIDSGETHKSLADLLPVYDAFLAARMERSTPVIGLGGGIVTDMAGFVAATILRGVPLIQVPTTLLSMVDASVGGKTGVNHAVGKNLIGAFHQPSAVFIDPQVLRTLPPRELRSGLAECIKHEIIRDVDGFAALEKNIGRALALDMDYLTDLIAHNVAIKARVVEADPFERGERAHLNFGHTFGHALETVFEYRYAHGECVALGMIAASRLAKSLGMLDDAAVQRIVAVIEQAGLPTRVVDLNTNAVASAMHFDKKVRSGKLRFILPDRIGHVVIRDDVSEAPVIQAIESLRS